MGSDQATTRPWAYLRVIDQDSPRGDCGEFTVGGTQPEPALSAGVRWRCKD